MASTPGKPHEPVNSMRGPSVSEIVLLNWLVPTPFVAVILYV